MHVCLHSFAGVRKAQLNEARYKQSEKQQHNFASKAEQVFQADETDSALMLVDRACSSCSCPAHHVRQFCLMGAHCLQAVREYLPSRQASLRLTIDATRVGNIARFFNHRCAPPAAADSHGTGSTKPTTLHVHCLLAAVPSLAHNADALPFKCSKVKLQSRLRHEPQAPQRDTGSL